MVLDQLSAKVEISFVMYDERYAIMSTNNPIIIDMTDDDRNGVKQNKDHAMIILMNIIEQLRKWRKGKKYFDRRREWQ